MFCFCFHACHGSNILLFSGYGEGSHFTTTAFIGTELISRGHNVTALISNAYAHRANESRYENMTFEIFTHNFPPEEVRRRFDRMTESAMKGSLFTDSLKNVSALLEEVRDDCEAIFDDYELLKRLADAEFDIALIDPMWACSMIVAEFAAKRFVIVMGTAWMNHLARPCGNPSNPATSPEMNTGFTNRMTFLQRVGNALMSVFGNLGNIHLEYLYPYTTCSRYLSRSRDIRTLRASESGSSQHRLCDGIPDSSSTQLHSCRGTIDRTS